MHCTPPQAPSRVVFERVTGRTIATPALGARQATAQADLDVLLAAVSLKPQTVQSRTFRPLRLLSRPAANCMPPSSSWGGLAHRVKAAAHRQYCRAGDRQAAVRCIGREAEGLWHSFSAAGPRTADAFDGVGPAVAVTGPVVRSRSSPRSYPAWPLCVSSGSAQGWMDREGSAELPPVCPYINDSSRPVTACMQVQRAPLPARR
jgi:hypothetical protein